MNPDKIIIAPMTHRHLEQVAEIEEASISDAWDIDAFEHELGVESALSYVLLPDDSSLPQQVSGYISSRVCHSECSINKISIHPSVRRKGLGAIILNHLISETAKMSVYIYYIEVESGNSAAALFYEKHGFKRTGVRKSYYRQGSDAVLMEMRRMCHGGECVPSSF